jgi:hypothetical protein
MVSVICPYCNTRNSLDRGAPIGALPPTGGDYEWQESDTKHTCANCQEKFEIRVRTSLESGELLALLSSPKPLVSSIIWYAIATVQKNTTLASEAGTFDVRIFHIAQTEAEIQSIFASFSLGGYIPKQILVTNQGYFFPNGEQISERSYYQKQINYS